MAADEGVDELYSLPIDEFTAARNELSKQLKDADAARAVKALKKPTVAAWAVNQLARKHPDDLGRLMELRSPEAASGDLRAGAEERRRLIARLTDSARSILVEGGHSASATTLEGVSKTLLAGGTEAERALILAGRLSKELAPAGFEGVFGMELPADGPEREVEPRAARRAEELAAKATDAEAEAKRAERAAEDLQKAADKAAQQAATARRKATEARTRADDALDSL
jgi:hypothetical protein